MVLVVGAERAPRPGPHASVSAVGRHGDQLRYRDPSPGGRDGRMAWTTASAAGCCSGTAIPATPPGSRYWVDVAAAVALVKYGWSECTGWPLSRPQTLRS